MRLRGKINEVEQAGRDEKGRPIVKPGQQPTAKNGYIAPKGGAKKGKARDGKVRWEDKYGNIWIPVSPGASGAHGVVIGMFTAHMVDIPMYILTEKQEEASRLVSTFLLYMNDEGDGMTAETWNQRALMRLEEQDFTGAQALFYENARRYPMHQTYHNLGCFLIDAGLTCKKGTVRQAHRLGLHYLQKAAVYRDSVQNLCAMIQHHVRGANEEIYSTVAPLLAKARRLGDCAALAYNDVALRLLCGRDTVTDIACAREFVLKDADRDTCMLLFYLLWRHAKVGDMLAYIERYGVWIDADALLVYYAACGMYEEGYCLSQAVLDEWNLDAYIVSAAVECHRHVARPSVNKSEHIASCIRTLAPSVASHLHRLAEKTDAAAQERSRLLHSYPKRVPLRFPCLYFGCQEHRTPWELT